LINPISALLRTCVPPQNSREKLGSIVTTRTLEPYLSPKNIFTFGIVRASSNAISSVSTTIPSRTLSLIICSTSRSSSGPSLLK
jgi:hypothetical protein